MNTTGNDCNALFDYFLIAHGAQDIVTKDGRLHLDDPKVREAVIKTLTYPTTAYKEGYVPPGAINWNDADDNNAFRLGRYHDWGNDAAGGRGEGVQAGRRDLR
jgi:multiple sugar transport system substrate-binding protein